MEPLARLGLNRCSRINNEPKKISDNDSLALVGRLEYDNVYKTWLVKRGAIKGCMVDFIVWLQKPNDIERTSLVTTLNCDGVEIKGYKE